MYKGPIPHQVDTQTGLVMPLTYQSWDGKIGETPPPNKWGGAYLWKDNEAFVDTLKVVTYSRGRSAANFCATSLTTGVNYSFFMSDFLDVIQTCKIDNGVIEEKKWSFIKKGANYGLQLHKD